MSFPKKYFLALIILGGSGLRARAQALPTAEAPGTLQIGGSAIASQSNYLPYDTQGNAAPISDLTRHVRSLGFGAYATFNFRGHLGVSLDMDRVAAAHDDTSSQLAFEGGARYVFFRGSSLQPYARASFGRGLYTYSNDAAKVGYNLYSFAGGLDYRLTRSFNVRVEYEDQQWLKVPLRNPSPQMIKVGIAYRFHSEILNKMQR